jgi:hypothetical protein
MLKEITLSELAKRAGVAPAELKRAISAETEETLSFDTEGEFITHTELDLIKERAGKDSYKEGKKAGEEMFIKEIKTDENLDFEGKTKDSLLKALKDKIQKETGSEPTKRITELEADKKKLQDTLTEKENELKNETEKFNSRLNGIEIESVIKNGLPEKLANGLTREDAYILYKSGREFVKTAEGIALVDPITKQVVKDKKLNPVSITDDLKTFLTRFGEVDNSGRGGDDKTPKGKTNIETLSKNSEVEAYFEKNETPLHERAGILQKAMKNEGFKINE